MPVSLLMKWIVRVAGMTARLIPFTKISTGREEAVIVGRLSSALDIEFERLLSHKHGGSVQNVIICSMSESSFWAGATSVGVFSLWKAKISIALK